MRRRLRLSLQGLGDLSLTTSRRHGRSTTSTTLFLPVGAGASAVTRTAGSGQQTSCSDTSRDENGGGAFFSAPAVAGGRVTLGLFSSFGPGLLGTRCAGPLIGDLRGALPTDTIGLRALAHGRRTLDLRATRRFAAHGFAGTVRSTITLTLGRPHRERVGRPKPPPGHRVHERALTATDRLGRLTGRATATVTTAHQPALCAPLDACGLSGTIEATPRTVRGGSLQLFAVAPASRPAAQLRAALNLTGAPPPTPRIIVAGGGEVRTRGAVTADLAQNGGSCRDATAISGAQLEAGVERSGRLRIALQPSTGATDPLRTRCPGPDLGRHSLATAIVPRAVWRRRTFAVTLRGTRFGDGPYRVAIHSTLRLVLHRSRVTSKVYEIPEPVRGTQAR